MTKKDKSAMDEARKALLLAAKALRMVILNRPENVFAPTNMGLGGVERACINAAALLPEPNTVQHPAD